MPLDLSTVQSVNPPRYGPNGQAWISWVPAPSFPAGNAWQIYVNSELAWHGTATGAWIMSPPGGTSRVVIGSVGPADESTDFSADLPPSPGRRALLRWTGGTTEGPDLAGFRIYSSPSPGQPVSYTKPIATVAAFPGGFQVGAGWDTFPWDTQPWDAAVGSYEWESEALQNGTWTFAICAYDTAGNERRPGQILAGTVAAPPAPPAPFSDGTRLHYTVLGWDQTPWDEAPWGYPSVRLNWNASPG